DTEELKEQLARLSVELSRAKESLELHKNSISYTRQVPTEVLDLSFQMCLPQTDYISPDSLTAPLLLCQICRAWRRLALATPLLW
ncbi:hypothetical protein B0H10DRAFT_1687893, partial [Mycena sp. CBHHK59/15]